MNGQPLGQALLQRGLISADQLAIALREQERSHEAIGRVLVRLGFLSEATLRDALSHALGRRSVDLDTLVPDPAALTLLPRDLACRLNVLPVSLDSTSRVLTVAAARIGDPILL
ncbi:MAG TPA: secretion system protein E, partial [Rhodocyclaceae bacterium]|nr:secretion system protein E [Rhodocyclaceae bacterium]